MPGLLRVVKNITTGLTLLTNRSTVLRQIPVFGSVALSWESASALHAGGY